MYIIYIERFLVLLLFSFGSFRIWQLFFFFWSRFGFRFSMKGVLLWCLMGVCVDKKIVQFLFCFVIDIYEFFLHMIHEKNVKIQINKWKH
jgi:hypothetical protein